MSPDPPSEPAPPPRRRPFGSVRARITAAAVLVVGVALAAAGTTLVTLVRGSLVDNVEEAAEVVADDLAAKLAAGTLPSVIPVPGGADDDDLLIQAVTPGGRVLAASENLTGAEPIVASGGAGTADTDGARLRRTVTGLPIDPEERFRILGEGVTVPSGERVTLYVGTELEPVKETVDDVRRALTVGFPLLLLLAGVAVWVLVGRALRPVEAIRRQVAEISDSALDRRVPEPAVDDEVGRLARTMNAMLARLQRSAERQRRFVSDASHELRSPLATTRTTLEVALAHPETTTWEAAAGDVLAETERMERLVDDLLYLAGADEGRLRPAAGPVDLDDVVAAEVARQRARAEIGRRTGRDAGAVTIDTSAVGAARVQGAAGHLERVVRNLVENASRHARSRVAVALTVDGATAVLTVTDDGPGVPAAERDRIFDRFVRLEEARARAPGPGDRPEMAANGAGLGLAIARDIVAAHRGDITVDDAPGGGARFVVRLPAV